MKNIAKCTKNVPNLNMLIMVLLECFTKKLAAKTKKILFAEC